MKLDDFTVGTKFTIYQRPEYWSNLAGGFYGLETLTFPYSSVILNRKSNAIKDCNGYGWSLDCLLKANNVKIVENSINIYPI